MGEGPQQPPDAFDGSTLAASGERGDMVATVAPGQGGHATITPGSRIGRYVVLAPLGAGGMGMVYKAYDPEIDRAVAVKLLLARRAAEGSTGSERLLREAKALGRLAHPNVVTVHDVGSHRGNVFIAMELVSGPNLSDWAKAEQRSLEEIVQTLSAAGRGLAAAHKAGIVHRDFKPANAVIGEDGRVRVLDFGLAREDAGIELGTDDASSLDHGLSLTMTGAIVGTPRFMAPEQFGGTVADERSDQFSFCVSMWWALYGEPPFTGNNIVELAQATQNTTPRPPAKSPIDVPSWIRELLLRGLRVDPAQRHASMDALLAALARDPAVRRRRIMAIVGLVVLAGLAGVGLTRGLSSDPEPLVTVCQSAAAEARAVWRPERRAHLRQSFARTRGAAAPDALARVSARLDDYTTRWQRMHTDACQATHVHGTQSAALLDLRMSCLAGRLRQADALLSVFLDDPDGDVVNNSVAAVYKLGALAPCADAKALRSAIPLPTAPEQRARVETLWLRVEKQEALLRAGKYELLLADADELAQASAATSFAPLEAALLLVHGEAQARLMRAKDARQTLARTIAAAARARDDYRAARAWTWLVFVIGYLDSQPQVALGHELAARAAAERSGSGFATVWLLNTLAAVRDRAGQRTLSRKLFEEAAGLLDESSDPELRAYTVSNLAVNLQGEGELRRAEKLFAQAIELARSFLGEHHPSYVFVVVNAGGASNALGNHTLALERCREGAALFRASDPDNVELARALSCEATALLGLSRAQEALLAVQEAERIATGHEPRAGVNGRRAFAHARALWALGRERPRAISLARKSKALFAEAPDVPAQRRAQVDAWLAEHSLK